MKISNKNNEKGISLLEIMVSILFFSLIALSLGHTLTGSLYVTARDNDIIKATNLAQQYFSEIEKEWQTQVEFDNPLLPELGDYTDGTSYTIEDPYFTYNDRYTVTVNVNDVSTDRQGNISLRRVEIIYEDNEGNNLINLFMDFARPGSYVVPG